MFKFLSPLKTFLLLKIIQDEINLGDLTVSNFCSYSPIMLCHEILGIGKIGKGVDVEVLDNKIRLGIDEHSRIWDYEICHSSNFTNYPENRCKYITIDFHTTKDYRTKGFNRYTALVDLNGKVILFGDKDKYFEPAKVINNKYILLSCYENGNEYKQRKYCIYSITGELLWSKCLNIDQAIVFSFYASERVCRIDSKYFFILGVYEGCKGRTEDIRIPLKRMKHGKLRST